MNEILLSAIFTIITASTPMILACSGEIITEKSGALNLGVEGMMIMGAVVGFYTSFHTGNSWLGLGSGIIAGMAMSMIFALLTIFLHANQVASGLALSIFGVGLSSLVGHELVGKNINLIEPIYHNLDIVAIISFGLVILVWYFLNKTKSGLILRAVGEDHASANALGYDVIKIRFAAILFGGACAGLSGAYLSIIYTPLWSPMMTAGRGWIALALVVFAAWRPLRALFGSLLFGGITILQLHAQGFGVPVPSQLLSAMPYIMTIFALIFLSLNKKNNLNAPKDLGIVFMKQS